MTKAELQRAQQLCEAAGVWLIVDNTYEDFTYDGREHTCVSGPNVINIFSMSKVWLHACHMHTSLKQCCPAHLLHCRFASGCRH